MLVSRVTNTMLKNTLLSNLGMNLTRMDKLQNQMSTGRKYGHISDDPSALIYGQAARNKLARLSHYQGSVSIAQNWLTQAEAGIMELQKVTGAIYEEVISAGSVKTPDDKKNLAKVVYQLRDHFVDTLNSSFGDRFVFGGYNTPGDFATGRREDGVKPFAIDPDSGDLLFNGFNLSVFDGMPAGFLGPEVRHGLSRADFEAELELIVQNTANLSNPPNNYASLAEFAAVFSDDKDIVPAMNADDLIDNLMMLHQLKADVITFDVGPAISMPVTMNGIDVLFYTSVDEITRLPVMRNAFSVITEVYDAINGTNVTDPADTEGTDRLTLRIKSLQDAQNHLLTRTAEIGGRQRRLELLEARYGQDNLNYEQMRSDAEDADMAEVIMFLKMAETVYQASLSAGARIIQPTLMDFLR